MLVSGVAAVARDAAGMASRHGSAGSGAVSGMMGGNHSRQASEARR